MDRSTILDASPSQLFSGALESRRALRKAYAALVHRYGPERDPECFRHIRDAYEVLNSYFDAPVAEREPLAETEPLASPPARASAALDSARVAPDVRKTLDACHDLLEEKRPLEGLQLLDENEAELRAREPVAWFELMVRAILDAGYAVPAERIRRAFDDLDNPEFDIDEGAYLGVAARWIAAQSWASARNDEQLPTCFLQALDAPPVVSRLELARRWRSVLLELGEAGLSQAYLHLAHEHPALLPTLHEIDNQVTGVGDFTLAWEFGSPAVRVPPAHQEELQALRLLRTRAMQPPRKPLSPLSVVLGGTAVAAVLGAFIPKAWDSAAAAAIVLVLGTLAALQHYAAQRDPRMRLTEELARRVRQLVSSSGMFRYEVMASLIGRRYP